jgi:hypothetical protein
MDIQHFWIRNTWIALNCKPSVVAPALEWLYPVIDGPIGGMHGANWEHDCAFVDPKTNCEKVVSAGVGNLNFEAMKLFWKGRADIPNVRIVALRRGEVATYLARSFDGAGVQARRVVKPLGGRHSPQLRQVLAQKPEPKFL